MYSTGNRSILKTVFGILLGVAVFALSYYSVQQIFKPTSFDKALVEAAVKLNKQCPMMVDEETRLDSGQALPNNLFQYYYSLVNLEKAAINADAVRAALEPTILNNVKANEGMKSFRDHKTTMVYNYNDKRGAFVFKISIDPQMYGMND